MSNIVNLICTIRGLKAIIMTYNLSKKENKTEEEKKVLKAFNKMTIISTIVLSISVIIMAFITNWCLERSRPNYFEGIVNSDKTISVANNSLPPLKPKDINVSESELIPGKLIYIIKNKNIIEISYEKPQNYIFILMFIYIIFVILMIIFTYKLTNHKDTKAWIIWYKAQNK